ncbi:MAG: hypothetical protein RLZZ142_2785, partial [Verrucomicrobiota bacterium]
MEGAEVQAQGTPAGDGQGGGE